MIPNSSLLLQIEFLMYGHSNTACGRLVDLAALSELDAAFVGQGLGAVNDRQLGVCELVMALLALFEPIQQRFPDLLRSLPLAIDLCLNFLLNVYDP